MYRTVTLDPPWTPSLHSKTDGSQIKTATKAHGAHRYDLMTLEEIIAFRPPVADRAHAYIWCLSQHTDWAHDVARAWGFDPVILMTWAKPGLGAGRFQCNTEHFLVARKGPKSGNAFGRDLPCYGAASNGTHFGWPKSRHSAKPQGFYDLVERMSPGPFLEMYARAPRLGWDVFGNEVEGSIIL